MVAARYTTSKPRRCEQIRSEASKSLTKNRCGAAATEPGHAGRREHPTNTLVDVRAGWRIDPMAVSDRVGLLDICAIPWLRSLRALQCDSHTVAIGRRALGLWRNFSHPRVEHALPGVHANFRRTVASCLGSDRKSDMTRTRLTPEERRERARLRSERWRRAHGIGPRKPAERPWLALGISRSTYYRRRAKARSQAALTQAMAAS